MLTSLCAPLLLCCAVLPLSCGRADLGDKAGQYSSDVAVLGLVVGLLLGGGYLVTQRTQQQQQQPPSSSSSHVQQQEVPPVLEAPREEVLQGQQK